MYNVYNNPDQGQGCYIHAARPYTYTVYTRIYMYNVYNNPDQGQAEEGPARRAGDRPGEGGEAGVPRGPSPYIIIIIMVVIIMDN